MHVIVLVIGLGLILGGCRQSPSLDPADSQLVPKTLYSHGPVEQITDDNAGTDLEPDVSCDGRWIAFTSTRHSTIPQVYLQSLRDGTIVQKTSSAYRNISPKISPDGQWLALISDRSGNFDLWVMPAHEDGVSWQLTTYPGEDRSPSWSPDGKRLAYSSKDEYDRWHLWIAELSSRNRTYLCPGEHPAWSPDGKHIAFQRASPKNQGWFSIWAFDLETGQTVQVTSNTYWGAISPAWSSDAQWLAFTAVTPTAPEAPDQKPGEIRQIWMSSARGSHLTRLTGTTGYEENPAWGTDGRLYFSCRFRNGQHLWRLQPDIASFKLLEP